MVPQQPSYPCYKGFWARTDPQQVWIPCYLCRSDILPIMYLALVTDSSACLGAFKVSSQCLRTPETCSSCFLLMVLCSHKGPSVTCESDARPRGTGRQLDIQSAITYKYRTTKFSLALGKFWVPQMKKVNLSPSVVSSKTQTNILWELKIGVPAGRNGIIWCPMQVVCESIV
jgi:hypothetical protein